MTYSSFDAYETNYVTVMDDVCAYTPMNGFNYYTSCFDCHGHGVCNGVLTQSDCNECLKEARDHLFNECRLRVGAQVQLKDCRIRYENYEFSE